MPDLIRKRISPVGKLTRDELYEWYLHLDQNLSPHASHLVEATLELVGVEDFLAAPAATIDGPYIEGLAEHSFEVAQTSIALRNISGYGAEIDLDAVVAGAILHDIGRVDEYGWATQPGGVGPHVGFGAARGQVIVMTAYERDRHHFDAVGLAPELVATVCHIIGTHHTSVACGSTAEPRCPEALVVAAAHQFSAPLRSMIERLDAAPELRDGWTVPTGNGELPVFSLSRLLSARSETGESLSEIVDQLASRSSQEAISA